jgi:hypothetical protein
MAAIEYIEYESATPEDCVRFSIAIMETRNMDWINNF